MVHVDDMQYADAICRILIKISNMRCVVGELENGCHLGMINRKKFDRFLP